MEFISYLGNELKMLRIEVSGDEDNDVRQPELHNRQPTKQIELPQ